MRPKPPRGVPIPPRPRQDQMDSGVTAAVWGRDLSVRPQNPHGASLAKCLHCVRTACALRAHCVHSAHAEARILTQEYHSSVQ